MSLSKHLLCGLVALTVFVFAPSAMAQPASVLYDNNNTALADVIISVSPGEAHICFRFRENGRLLCLKFWFEEPFTLVTYTVIGQIEIDMLTGGMTLNGRTIGRIRVPG